MGVSNSHQIHTNAKQEQGLRENYDTTINRGEREKGGSGGHCGVRRRPDRRSTTGRGRKREIEGRCGGGRKLVVFLVVASRPVVNSDDGRPGRRKRKWPESIYRSSDSDSGSKG
ncbi:hypothetical protein FXO37_15144 [Capsicum annuum]|nr:hypothetical protein FXO37_15144 [Capsicum annuum]